MCVQRSDALVHKALVHKALVPKAPVYEICLQGYLSLYWSHWFDDMVITHDGAGHTLLTGPIVDQAALHGLLDKAHDLGLPLLGLRLIGL